jgi:phage terminase large subunit GpA-like protein
MYDRAYFDGLCSEVRVVLENGQIEYKKKPGQERNEPLDLAVYNLAMAAIVGVDRFTPERWAELREQVGVGKVKTEKLESKTQPEELTPIPTPPPISVASAPPASTVAAVVATDLRPSLQTRRPATRTVRGSFL